MDIKPLHLVNSHRNKLEPLPSPKDIADFIELTGDLTFSMSHVCEVFLGRKSVYNPQDRSLYDRLRTRVAEARKIIERKYGGRYVTTWIKKDGKLRAVYEFKKQEAPVG